MSDYSIPDENFYTEQDEWVRFEDDRIVIGITDYAQQQLGDVVFVELPEVGSSINKEETFGVIESVKAVSDLYAPLTGTVVAVNQEIVDAPERINEDCYGEGWLIAIEPADPDENESLLHHQGYKKYLDERSD